MIQAPQLYTFKPTVKTSTYMFSYCAMEWPFKADSCAWQVVRKPLIKMNA